MKRVVTIVALALATVGGRSTATSLPERLTNPEFWRLTLELSEPDGRFIADNLVSNERSFAQTLPQLAAQVAPGGAYVGVGPEQNFSFIATTRPAMAFVIDIRRDNYRLHLLYKALFAISEDRAAFVSKLFSRSCEPASRPNASAARLIASCDKAAVSDDAAIAASWREIKAALALAPSGALSPEDWAGIERVRAVFARHGARTTYSLNPRGEVIGPFGFGSQVTQLDGTGAELGFLATEASYRFVRDLQLRNLIIPVVGNFAGPNALRRIGDYLQSRGAVVHAFYVSNVEDYLGRSNVGDAKNGDWEDFCMNVSSMPVDAASVFVRPFGVAAYDAAGTLTVAREISISGSKADATTYARGVPVVLPTALFAIQPELAACGGVSGTPPRLVLGAFDDDYGSRHAIQARLWGHGRTALYHIVKWNLAEQYLIAQNDAANPSDPGLWSRIDWMPLENMPPFTWAFCMSAYKAKTFEEAEQTTIAKRDAPKTGCNGFPFTRMKKAG